MFWPRRRFRERGTVGRGQTNLFPDVQDPLSEWVFPGVHLDQLHRPNHLVHQGHPLVGHLHHPQPQDTGQRGNASLVKQFRLCRDPLLKGKAQYSWPPCTYQFRSVTFLNWNYFCLFYKKGYPNKEVNGTDPSLSISVPRVMLHKCSEVECIKKAIKNSSVGTWKRGHVSVSLSLRESWITFEWMDRSCWNFCISPTPFK